MRMSDLDQMKKETVRTDLIKFLNDLLFQTCTVNATLEASFSHSNVGQCGGSSETALLFVCLNLIR